ncbi:MAG TPA: restriction endonuclease subunit S, partial [Anaerolineales bacterium]|nr:restriction endonuclease subunit S [Anaerolineales bacterium]
DKAWGRISRADHERYSKKYRPMLNDIYMVKSGATTGVTAIVEDSREFNIWSPLAAIRSNEKVLPRFLLNALRSASFKDGVALNWSYGTQQNIGMKVLENLPVQLPPLSEQVDIIETIDRETARIDALILKKSRFVELLEEKRLTVITTAVTKGLNSGVKMKASGVEWIGAVPKHWAVCKLSYRYSVELGKMLDEKKMTGKNPVPYLRNKDVQWQQINVNDLPIIDITPQEIDRYTVKSGDLLVCEGGDVGRAAIWRGDDNVIGYQKALHRLPPVSG